MSRKTQVVAVAVVTVLGIGVGLEMACNQPQPDTARASRQVTDMTSRTVSIPASPRRVLSLCSSATDTMVRIGAGERLAAIDEYSRIVPGTADAITVGKGSAVSPEQIVSTGIDMAFIWWYQDDAAAVLDTLSVPAIRIRSGRAAEIPAMIRLVGQCLDCSEAADRVAEEVAQSVRLAAAGEGSSARRVYIELYGPLKTVGGDSYIGDLIEFAGGRNVADAASAGVLLSAEHLIEADPEVILFVDGFATPSSISRRSGMAAVKAVQAGCVYPVDRYWLVAGPGLPTAVANLRQLIARGSDPPTERRKNGVLQSDVQ